MLSHGECGDVADATPVIASIACTRRQPAVSNHEATRRGRWTPASASTSHQGTAAVSNHANATACEVLRGSDEQHRSVDLRQSAERKLFAPLALLGFSKQRLDPDAALADGLLAGRRVLAGLLPLDEGRLRPTGSFGHSFEATDRVRWAPHRGTLDPCRIASESNPPVGSSAAGGEREQAPRRSWRGLWHRHGNAL